MHHIFNKTESSLVGKERCTTDEIKDATPNDSIIQGDGTPGKATRLTNLEKNSGFAQMLPFPW